MELRHCYVENLASLSVPPILGNSSGEQTTQTIKNAIPQETGWQSRGLNDVLRKTQNHN